MKIFIFESVDRLTRNYHESGGLVIVAQDLERALKMASEYEEGYFKEKCIKLTESEISDVVTYNLVDIGAKEKLFVFENAGCC